MPRPLLAALLLVALPACGGGDDPGSTDEPAGRVVELTATDALRFDPATVTAKAGEKVTFRIANTGKARHEFVIGDDGYHAEHARAMGAGEAQGGHGGHDDRGSSTALPPGATTEVTFTMPDKAPRFACYVDRHNEAGMTGTVTYG